MLSPDHSALVASLVEVERHVGASGWDQPSRLFALVRTADLIAAEPQLANQLGAAPPDGFSSVEQDDFHPGADVLGALQRISWPETVAGCVMVVERCFLSKEHEDDIPDDDTATDYVASHPDKQDIRVVVGALRDGSSHGVARLMSSPDELLGGDNLVPGLSAGVLGTLQ